MGHNILEEKTQQLLKLTYWFCFKSSQYLHILSKLHFSKFQVVALSTHSYGCRVIQRILERCGELEKAAILNELIENFSVLVVDQYGNYVVQHILQHGHEMTRSRIIKLVRKDLLRLSQHKFAR